MITQLIHQIADSISSVSPQILAIAGVGIEWLCRRLPTEKSIGIIAAVRGIVKLVKSVLDELDRLIGVVDGVVEKVLPENQAASLPKPPGA